MAWTRARRALLWRSCPARFCEVRGMNTSAAVQPERLPANDRASVKLRCVRCTGSMGSPVQRTDLAVDRRECIRCASVMQAIDGIWRAISPGRARLLDASLTAYESVREKE